MMYLQYAYKYRNCLIPLSHEKSKSIICSLSQEMVQPHGYSIRMHLSQHKYIFSWTMCIISYAYVVILNTYRNTLEYNLSIISVVLIMLYLQIIFHNRNTEMTRITAVNSLKRTVLILLIGKCIEYSVQCISSIDKSSPILLYLGVEQSVVYTGMVLYSLGYSDMSAYWRVLLSTSAVYCIKLFMCCNFNKIE